MKKPQVTEPISRKSLAWLFAVQILVLAPHFISAPWWIAIVWLMVAVWRWNIFQGAWAYPNRWHKTFAVIICCAGLFASFGVSFRFESMVSLLLIGFTLKLLEMKTRTDFVLLIFIGFFILAAQFIQFNHFLAVLYGFVILILLSTSLMLLYKKPVAVSLWQDVRPSTAIILQAIPFMLILFVVAPRLGTFWSVPSPQHAKTGMSDSMSPGDFTELMESNELAFRVVFKGKAPEKSLLYWRSLVFSLFDGRGWSQTGEQKSANRFGLTHKKRLEHIDYLDEPIEYDIIAEPSDQPWLYLLGAPESWSSNVEFARELRLEAFFPVKERMVYHVATSLNYRLNETYPEELEQNRKLPVWGNPKTRERALEWMAETGSTEKLIEKIFQYYNKSFFYTLRPPALGADVVDDFLWNSRQGFCEHFASSFVFLMRAAGVPARVVVGYQGGDLNSVDGSLAVRQRDAHAWAEVWLESRGWVMFDPTGAVAPERVRRGIEQSLSPTDQKFLAKSFGSSFKILLRLREQWDAANLQWTRWVMNYDSAVQTRLLENLFGDASPLRIAFMLLSVIGGLAVLLFAILMIRARKPAPSEATQLYFRLCKKLKPAGYVPQAGESLRQFLDRVMKKNPQMVSALLSILNLYERLVYAEDLSVMPQLKREIQRLRFKTSDYAAAARMAPSSKSS